MEDKRLTTRRKLLVLLAGAGVSGTALAHRNQFISDGGRPPTTAGSVGFVQETENSEYRVATLSEEYGVFSSADGAVRTLFDSLESGVVLTGGGRYLLESQLRVPEGFRLSNTADGLFINGLSDSDTKCLRFASNTGSYYLRVDCGKKDGVLLGEPNTGSDIDIWYADIHRAGTGNGAQDALKIQGSGVKIFHINVYQGSNGILLDGAYDIHVLSSIITNSGIGLRIDGAENCFFDQMDFDSCRNYSVRIDDSAGLTLGGYIWNNTEFDAWPYRSVEIGVNKPCNNIYTDMKQLSNPGAALYVDDVEESHLRHDISEADRSWYEYESGITTTENTADSCYIEGYVSPTINSGIANLTGGTFDITGAGTNSSKYMTGSDGSQTVFRIPHELGKTPTKTRVQPRTPSAAGAFYHRDPDQSAIVIEYVSPPAAGDDNLVWEFTATV